MITKKLAACAAALALSPGAHAYNVGTPTTFSSLIWTASFNAPGLGSCVEVRLDGTGDLSRSNVLAVAGALNCVNLGGFGMVGSLYLSTDGSMNLTMLTAGYNIACPRIVNWFGTCTVFDGNGAQRGTGTIRLL